MTTTASPTPTPSLVPSPAPVSAQPTALTLHQTSQTLEVAYDDGSIFTLPFEFLRVHSPSAEVQGHGPGQETLQVGKRGVAVTELSPVGHYAVQPTFSDGHSSGLFSWGFLYFLGQNQALLWGEYLAKLAAAGASREAAELGTELRRSVGKAGCA